MLVCGTAALLVDRLLAFAASGRLDAPRVGRPGLPVRSQQSQLSQELLPLIEGPNGNRGS